MAKRSVARLATRLADVQQGVEDTLSLVNGVFALMDHYHAAIYERVEEETGFEVFGVGGVATNLADQGSVLLATQARIVWLLEQQRARLDRINQRLGAKVVSAAEPTTIDDGEAWLREHLATLNVDPAGGAA